MKIDNKWLRLVREQHLRREREFVCFQAIFHIFQLSHYCKPLRNWIFTLDMFITLRSISLHYCLRIEILVSLIHIWPHRIATLNCQSEWGGGSGMDELRQLCCVCWKCVETHNCHRNGGNRYGREEKPRQSLKILRDKFQPDERQRQKLIKKIRSATPCARHTMCQNASSRFFNHD